MEPGAWVGIGGGHCGDLKLGINGKCLCRWMVAWERGHDLEECKR